MIFTSEDLAATNLSDFDDFLKNFDNFHHSLNTFLTEQVVNLATLHAITKFVSRQPVSQLFIQYETGFLHRACSICPTFFINRVCNYKSLCWIMFKSLIRCFGVSYYWIFLLVVCTLTRPAGSLKYSTTCKNTQ